jgi:hypothetical protein
MSDSSFFMGENKDPLKPVKTTLFNNIPHECSIDKITLCLNLQLSTKKQTINVTNYHIVKVIREVRRLDGQNGQFPHNRPSNV